MGRSDCSAGRESSSVIATADVDSLPKRQRRRVEDRCSPLPTTINRKVTDYRGSAKSACTSSVSARHSDVTRSDQGQRGDAERQRQEKAAFSETNEMRNSADPRRKHRRAGPESHLAAEVDIRKSGH